MNASNPTTADYPSRRLAWYAVVVLTICYTFSFIDRLILGFLVDPLKADLHLSDTRIGLLLGLAFAIFYAILGVPMGFVADRTNRRNLIIIGVLLWSLMTTFGSVAGSFATLALARMGVGVGEATLAPSAFSMIADYFPKERLSSALSVYSMGIQVGAGLALMVGGLVTQAVMHLPHVSVPVFGSMAPWRVTFLIVGIPGVFVAALLATVREPVRRRLAAAASATRPMQSLHRVAAELRSRWQSATGVSIIMACQAMSNYAFGSWTPAYFVRIHHWPKGQAGLVLGALTLGCGCVGLFCGGRLSDRWLKRDVHEAPLRVGLVSLVGVAITLVPAMLMPSAGWTIALLVPAVFFLALPIGCSYASIQMIFPNEVRGAVSAVMLLVLNLFGLTLGTLLPGLLDDRLFHNEQMLGASIAITAGIASAIGAVTALGTFAPYRRDFTAMHAPGAQAR